MPSAGAWDEGATGPTLESFFIYSTDNEEILGIIKKLKNKRSRGIDNISVELLKEIGKSIAPALEHIFNLSFKLGCFPTCFKKSVVVPLIKKSNSIKMDNLRPISLLPIPSKILEKIMKKRLLSFLNSKHFFSENQFGFTKGKSTEDALSVFVERLYSSINFGKKASALFIDYKKAFDLVDQTILLSKLEHAGIRGVAHSWFSTYLSNREQIVKFKDCFSEPEIVEKGVPQGSVLSATLFLIYINDLLKKPFMGKMYAFADDLVLLYDKENEEEIWQCIMHDLNILKIWCVIVV